MMQRDRRPVDADGGDRQLQLDLDLDVAQGLADGAD